MQCLQPKCDMIIVFGAVYKNENANLHVRLPQGIVQGKMNRTVDRRTQYFSFEGIPYAQPPVGVLRFRPPVPAGNWDGVLNATVMHVPSCVQVTPSFFNGFEESEDCLYVNVFTPIKVNSLSQINRHTKLLPVMVWIYGGAFLLGSANASYFGPDNLLEEGVVVVHFGYRLSSFGFLSTEDMESPGNYGLKDQHLALRWTKDNVRHFGGDPNKITIFGESAGSVSVQYQLMYPANQGLFQGAISESGSALCIWAYQRQPKKIAFDLGRSAGLRTNDTRELINYLRNITTEKLKSATMKASIKNSLGIINGIPFAPVIEPEHKHAFITEKNHKLLSEGKFLKVPYIIGFNSEEAAIAKSALDVANPILRFYDFDFSTWVPTGMNVGENTDTVGKKIRDYYFNTSKSRADQYLEYINDGYFFRPIIESARLFGLLTPTYMYAFTYEGMLGRKALGYSEVDEYKGVVHTEEMAYIWSRNNFPEPNNTDRITRARMIKMWTNFAKEGNPTPESDHLLQNIIWPQVGTRMAYLNINRSLSARERYKNKAMGFWERIYSEYGNPPYDTY
ncbi:hypothetical protein NQ317_009106 [Molorchus minor]|uniref:Carboxylic ester hydrolase n=1 Tax=Molorchus minor TaxID=1323400 RepID=A0ABQ9J8U8_9CUCU|nr:hypothetical protein NQ317_009106 [Molorchus minor]